MGEVVKSRAVVINNPQGLHARPADLFVKLACQFNAQVNIVKGGERADGKSILSLMTLAVECGEELRIEAVGDDAEQALEALEELVRRNFAEDETK